MDHEQVVHQARNELPGKPNLCADIENGHKRCAFQGARVEDVMMSHYMNCPSKRPRSALMKRIVHCTTFKYFATLNFPHSTPHS